MCQLGPDLVKTVSRPLQADWPFESGRHINKRHCAAVVRHNLLSLQRRAPHAERARRLCSISRGSVRPIHHSATSIRYHLRTERRPRAFNSYFVCYTRSACKSLQAAQHILGKATIPHRSSNCAARTSYINARGCAHTSGCLFCAHHRFHRSPFVLGQSLCQGSVYRFQHLQPQDVAPLQVCRGLMRSTSFPFRTKARPYPPADSRWPLTAILAADNSLSRAHRTAPRCSMCASANLVPCAWENTGACIQ